MVGRWAIVAVLVLCGACTAAPDPPGDPGAIVLRIQDVPGGPVGPVNDIGTPELTLYTDGTLITVSGLTGVVPQLRRTQLSAEGIRRILLGARYAGLLREDRRIGGVGVEDPGGSVVTVVTADGPATTMVLHGPDAGNVVGRLLEAPGRANLERFLDMLPAPERWMPSEVLEPPRSYEPPTVTVFWAEIPGPSDVPGVRWPLDDLAVLGEAVDREGVRCAEFSGEDRDAVLRVAEETLPDESVAWISEGRRYSVRIRPLLPGERSCTDIDLDFLYEVGRRLR